MFAPPDNLKLCCIPQKVDKSKSPRLFYTVYLSDKIISINEMKNKDWHNTVFSVLWIYYLKQNYYISNNLL